MSKGTLQSLIRDVTERHMGRDLDTPELREIMAVEISQEMVARGVTGLRARLVPDPNIPGFPRVEFHIVDINDKPPNDGWWFTEED